MRKISWVEGTQEILKDLSPSRSSWMHLVVEKLVNLSSFMTILLPIFNRGANHEEMIKQLKKSLVKKGFDEPEKK